MTEYSLSFKVINTFHLCNWILPTPHHDLVYNVQNNYNFQDDKYSELQKTNNFFKFLWLAFPGLLLLCCIKFPEIFFWEKITSSIILTYVYESLSKFITYFPLATKRKITKEFILKKENSTKYITRKQNIS